jgi:hypothetical protein
MRIRATILLSLVCCMGPASPVSSQTRSEGGDVAVVVNADVPVDNLSIFDVQHVFRGEKQFWKRNLKVVLLAPPAGGHERDVMLHVVYKMSESEYKQYWIGRIFRAEAISAPRTADSTAAARNLVASLPGCVTLMNASEVRPGNKILKIDGKFPGERGYPLRYP